MIPSSGVGLHEFEVVSNEEVATSTWRLVLRAPALAGSIRPGQFMNLEVPGDPSHPLRIPLSFASADAVAGTVDLVYAVVGEGTERLSHMAPGQHSTAVGPSGHGWRLPEPVPVRVLLVAGGVGAPPIVAAAGMLAGAGVPFDAVLGAQTASRLWGEERLSSLGAGTVLVTTDDGSRGIKGFTTDAMSRLLGERDYGLVMSCGPQPMMAGVARLARSAGIACQVSTERMMGCGFGACNSCNVTMAAGGYRSCCSDGPVFDAEELAW